jgi:hypothetical protein
MEGENVDIENFSGVTSPNPSIGKGAEKVNVVRESPKF